MRQAAIKVGERRRRVASLGEDYLYWFELSLENCISYL
jgi:hypothetical protein